MAVAISWQPVQAIGERLPNHGQILSSFILCGVARVAANWRLAVSWLSASCQLAICWLSAVRGPLAAARCPLPAERRRLVV